VPAKKSIWASGEDGFWDLYREVTKRMPIRGKDVPDAVATKNSIARVSLPWRASSSRSFLEENGRCRYSKPAAVAVPA